MIVATPTDGLVAGVDVWLPTDPPTPCPDVLTADEAVAYLRLDRVGVSDPRRCLARLVQSGRIKPLRYTRTHLFARSEIERFIQLDRIRR